MQISFHHAHITRIENGEYFITDLGSEKGTWVGDKHLKPHEELKLHPEDSLYFGSKKPECIFKVKLAHHSVERQLQEYIDQINTVSGFKGADTTNPRQTVQAS